MASTADVTVLVMLPVALAFGLWATAEQFEGLDSELANNLIGLLGQSYELVGMVLILAFVAFLLSPMVGR